jgi:hypothetical protein
MDQFYSVLMPSLKINILGKIFESINDPRMKRLSVTICILLGMFLLSECKKGSSNTAPSEAILALTTNPPTSSFQLPGIEPFNLTVTITSTIPSGGVKIDVSAKKDDGSGSAPFYSTSVNSTTSVNNFTITNTPIGVQCLVEIKVTSLSKSSNQWTGSYHYSRKS